MEHRSAFWAVGLSLAGLVIAACSSTDADNARQTGGASGSAGQATGGAAGATGGTAGTAGAGGGAGGSAGAAGTTGGAAGTTGGTAGTAGAGGGAGASGGAGMGGAAGATGGAAGATGGAAGTTGGSAGATGGAAGTTGGSAGSGGSAGAGGSAGKGGSGGAAGKGGAAGSGGPAGVDAAGPDGSTAACDNPALVWKTGAKTEYTSYPDPGSEECIVYSGCEYMGMFAACNGVAPEAWVASHNIVALFPDFNTYRLHDLCLKSSTGKTIVVTVLDTCGDSDCGGCCTRNKGTADALIDVESYTAARWGVPDGRIQWADLGPTKGDGCP